MKTALTVLFLLTPLAFCQATEVASTGAYLAPVPTHLRLLPKDSFFNDVKTSSSVIQWPKEQPRFAFYTASRGFDDRLEQIVTPNPIWSPVISPRVQLAVIRSNHHPVDGNVGKQLKHVFVEGFSNLATYNNAELYYRENKGYNFGSADPRYILNYHRSHAMGPIVYGPAVKFLRDAAWAQLRHDILKKR